MMATVLDPLIQQFAYSHNNAIQEYMLMKYKSLCIPSVQSARQAQVCARFMPG